MLESWIFFVVVSFTVPHEKAGQFGGKLFGVCETAAQCRHTQGRIELENHKGMEVLHVTPCIKVPNREKT